MIVVLAEKPAQAQSYCEALGKYEKREGYFFVPKNEYLSDETAITYGFGHLVELKTPEEYKEEWGKWEIDHLPLLPEKFEFKVSKDKKKQFNFVKDLLKKAKKIVVACDSDREGENIARLVIKLAGCENKKIERLWINSLEADEVKKGFQNLRDGKEYIGLYYESQARQISDWLVGINASRVYSLALQKKGIRTSFSLGRVQSPTLKMIYDRQVEIENFKPESFFTLESIIEAKGIIFIGKYQNKFSRKEDVDEVLNKHGIQKNEKQIAEIKEKKVTTKETQSPKLHSLATLQTLANKKFKYSPSQTLEIVQQLYDRPLKLLSYPRSECNHITISEFNYLKERIKDYQQIISCPFEEKFLEPRNRYVDNNKVQEHYAIIPTKIIPGQEIIDTLTVEQKNIYFEIIRNVLAMFHENYLYEETEIVTDIKGLSFVTKGKLEKNKGWKELFINDQLEEKNEDENILLPNVTEKEKYPSSLKMKEGITTAPSYYTEGQLINLMKNCGVSEHDLHLDEEDSSVTDEAIKTLKSVEGIGTSATRASIIETLKKQKYIEVKKNKVYVTEKGKIICEAIEGSLLANPLMTGQWEMFLKKIGTGEKTKESFIGGTVKFITKLVEKAKEDINQMDLKERSESYRKSVQNIIGKCPKCGKEIIDRKTFYGCTGYKDGCKFTLTKEYLGKKISESNAKKMLEGKKTTILKGLKSKSEKVFDAHLKLNNGRIELEFPKKKIVNVNLK